MADVPNLFAGAQLPRTPMVHDLARGSRPVVDIFNVNSSRAPSGADRLASAQRLVGEMKSILQFDQVMRPSPIPDHAMSPASSGITPSVVFNSAGGPGYIREAVTDPGDGRADGQSSFVASLENRMHALRRSHPAVVDQFSSREWRTSSPTLHFKPKNQKRRMNQTQYNIILSVVAW
eukprot:SAG11_NODE_323_length_10745_cov_18.203926_7_plen_177_part_00